MNMFSRKNKKGFTLIELIVVIAILAILAAIAIPSFIGITDSANEQVARANASNIATAYNSFNALHPDKPLDAEKSSFTIDNIDDKIGTDLWPRGLDTAEVTAAWDYLSITGGVAEVLDTPAAPTT